MSRDPVLHFGPYRLDLGNEQLWCDEQLVRLTPKAFQVLRMLMSSSGQLVTKDEFFRAVWAETVVSDAALTSCIQELRQALGDNARNPQYIETVHRRGFRFIAPSALPQRCKVQRSRFKERKKQPVAGGVGRSVGDGWANRRRYRHGQDRDAAQSAFPSLVSPPIRLELSSGVVERRGDRDAQALSSLLPQRAERLHHVDLFLC